MTITENLSTPTPEVDRDDDGDHIAHFDVLIVGAGISGIGVAYHMSHHFPEKSVAIFEARSLFGGTWDIHRYPGVRSDSDMYTFGYSFKPWLKDRLATGQEIQKYLEETLHEHDLSDLIHYEHRVTAANWSSESKRWFIDVQVGEHGKQKTYSANFLWMCQGFYNYEKGYTPDWPGLEDYAGEMVHPLHWPEHLDFQGKRIVVVGSGATAATLIPALVREGAGPVTMLQRSPTYFQSLPQHNELAETLRSLDTPPMWTHEIVRRLVLKEGLEADERLAKDRRAVQAELLENVRQALPEGYDVDTHFTPKYPLWTQRTCAVPEGDLFETIRSEKATVVTDTIERFVPGGIRLSSGEVLEADIVVTATGFILSVMGEIPFTIDKEPLDWSKTVTFHGTMFSGVPNLAYIFGYFRASWTLRVDLIAEFIVRLMRHMDLSGATSVTPELREEDKGMTLIPWINPEKFSPSYMARDIHKMPKQGDRQPWVGSELTYYEEVPVIEEENFDDGSLIFR